MEQEQKEHLLTGHEKLANTGQRLGRIEGYLFFEISAPYKFSC